MDHKDLLNDVVKNMATNNAPKEDVISQEELTNSIPLVLSVGEQFLVNAKEYDWNSAVEKLPIMEMNMAGIRGIMRSLVDKVFGKIPNDRDENEDLAGKAIDEFNKFFKMFGIDIDYKSYFKDGKEPEEEMGKLAIAMLMGFDAYAISATMKENTTNYQTLTVLQQAYSSLDEIIHDNEEIANDIIPEGNIIENDEKKTYRVAGKYVVIVDDQGDEAMSLKEIVDVKEIDYVAPDEQYIVDIDDIDDNERIVIASTTVMAYTISGAKAVATRTFDDYAGDIDIPGVAKTTDDTDDTSMSAADLYKTFGFDDHTVSGLLDDWSGNK